MAKEKIMQSCFCPSKKVPQILIPVTDELLWVLKPSALSEGLGGPAKYNVGSASPPVLSSPFCDFDPSLSASSKHELK